MILNSNYMRIHYKENIPLAKLEVNEDLFFTTHVYVNCKIILDSHNVEEVFTFNNHFFYDCELKLINNNSTFVFNTCVCLFKNLPDNLNNLVIKESVVYPDMAFEIKERNFILINNKVIDLSISGYWLKGTFSALINTAKKYIDSDDFTYNEHVYKFIELNDTSLIEHPLAKLNRVYKYLTERDNLIIFILKTHRSINNIRFELTCQHPITNHRYIVFRHIDAETLYSDVEMRELTIQGLKYRLIEELNNNISIHASDIIIREE